LLEQTKDEIELKKRNGRKKKEKMMNNKAP
jgi:hypothetical protein